MRKLLGIMLALCMTICIVPYTAFAGEGGNEPTATVDDPYMDTSSLSVVQIDVTTASASTDDYVLTETQIKLLNQNVVYELTGETTRDIVLSGSTDILDKAFYIKLNGASVGKVVINQSPVRLVVDVVKKTDGEGNVIPNKMGEVNGHYICIKGDGSLETTDIGVYPPFNYGMQNALKIKDTNITVNCVATRGCQWYGDIVLYGNANIKINGNGKYAPVSISDDSGTSTTASLTLKDNAKLYCLQDSMTDTTKNGTSVVDGIDMYFYGTIKLEDNSYLEVEGKDSTNTEGYKGYGIVSYGDIIIDDKASLKATAYAVGFSCDKLEMGGGSLDVKSYYSNAIYTMNTVALEDADVKLDAYYPALFAEKAVSIKNSKVDAKASNEVALFSKETMTIENSKIKATGTPVGIRSWGNQEIKGSWVELNADEAATRTVTDSAIFVNNVGTVTGDLSIPSDVTVTTDMSLTISENTSITVTMGKTFTNNGTITLDGTFTNNGGTVICTRHTGGTANCKDKATCGICTSTYGEIASDNHANLVHIPAQEPTREADGNEEYWYCDACGKYYMVADGSDELEEVTEADTVIEKLPAQPETGDGSDVAIWLAILILSGVMLTATYILSKKKHTDIV